MSKKFKRNHNLRHIKQAKTYDVQEICSTLGVHSGTVYQWKRRGLKTLAGVYPLMVHGSQLVAFLKEEKAKRVDAVISSHHSLFFNVMWNELKRLKTKYKTHFYHRSSNSDVYTLRSTDETPFFHHVAMLSELHKAVEEDQIYTYHFNMLRSILEKTATFFGYKDFSACVHGIEDEVLHLRALNLLSHGKYSIYEPKQMVDDTKELFKRVFSAFLERYRFELPEITRQQEAKA